MTMSWTGLAAESWDWFGGDEPQSDCEMLRSLVRRQEGPALDVGCGTGRLLLRFAGEGLDVHGIDTSADMLAFTRAKAARRGLDVTLWRQAMEELDVPHRYATIFVTCGSIMLLLDDETALRTLAGFRAHLAPDGVLAMNFFDALRPPDSVFGEWVQRRRDPTPDGTIASMFVIADSYDEVTRVMRGRRRYTLERDGELVREEYLDDLCRRYGPAEIGELARAAGFTSCSITGDYAGEPLGDEHRMMSVEARRD